MGNACCCCSKGERTVEDLLDGSLEDKLLGKRDDDVEATTAEEEAWRQRREQLKDEADLSLADDNDKVNSNARGGKPDADVDHAPLVWDLSDRNTVRAARKTPESVEDEEDEEAFGSAKEEADADDQGPQEHRAGSEEFDADRLTQLSARSAEDSYASMNEYFRDDTRIFRDTEVDRATEADSFLVQQQDKQQHNEEKDDEQAEEESSPDKSQSSSSSSSRRRASKKKSRSRKSSRK
ncbi:hypothetical protein PF010_g23520 [Phytophthora fragariae]|uniref:Uncharacterized protein n=1 Tax=Phytophthora fragariae TaxID=53985 RepID=A0A6A4C2I8_9STRA|nr:hypothetical protein PF009_g24994 [Phytophthora fragariae]KAE8979449.1 hypothetical protein PF011_g22842 [Phytophthora fragariae]KAE9077407.1 hypothetical protein PF010_g23520 [Phytophthora fragariae]KAE9077520.1 hypothetical protein PF007_g24219 [Phytophthora fragariae]KAE9097842.1 hypothetical protein PF006_g23487 [Phytophthora fragariae]